MEGIEVRQFTRQEAEAAVDQFVSTGWSLRHMILEMYDRRAHTALGFPEFSEFARQRLGGEWSDSYLSQLRSWARMERIIGDDVHKQLTYKGSLTKREADELLRLPEEKVAQAYSEAILLHADNPLRDLKHIVNRMLGASDHYGKKAEKIVEQEVDIPVGAVVDVHTGRPVEPEEPLSTTTALLSEEVLQREWSGDPPVDDEDAPIPADTPSHDISELDKVFDYTPLTKKPEEGWLSDEAVARLNQFRAFWQLDSDIATIEKIIGQLYTTYSNKPNFAKLAE